MTAVLFAELRKLLAQLRVRVVLVGLVVLPFVFALALRVQDAVPKDTLFGRWVHESGLALPLVTLGFAGTWAFPLLTSVVAGDMFAGEDAQGTWATILTRSRDRSEVFAGKVVAALVWAVVVVVVPALASLAAGLLVINDRPVIGLSGQAVSAGRGAVLVLVSWATALVPVIGFTCVAVLASVASRSSWVGVAAPAVLGLVMQLASFISVNGVEVARAGLLTTPFDAWHGLLTTPRFVAPIGWGAVATVVYVVASLVIAWRIFRVRDVAGRVT